MDRETVIKAIEDFSATSGLKPSTICQYALRNRLVYDKLKNGGSPGFSSIERLMDWMRDYTESHSVGTDG